MIPTTAVKSAVILLRTKLTVPAPHTHVLERPRLTARLEAAGGCVTLVSAPAGFGKTTFVAAWAHRQPPGAVAWISLDADDNDVRRFWYYVTAVLRAPDQEAGQQTNAAAPDAGGEQWQAQVATLINELTALVSPVTLVLDDYHTIHANPIHQSLAFLLQHQPPLLHVIVITRADPPLALARLRVAGRLTEIRAADLQFRTAEAARFFECVLSRQLPAEMAARLTARTEGWAAGMQLAALSLQQLPETEWASFVRAFGGANRHVLHYLAEEVVQRQPERIQRFLLQTAVLPYLTPALCTAVTECGDAGHILAYLAETQMFVIPLDKGGRLYRYHPLMAEALREYLETLDPTLIPRLRQRAEAWQRQHEADCPQGILTEPLTTREREILALITEGLSNQQIAEHLVISIGTVKGHINHLLSKLNAQNRTEAVMLAQRLNLL